MISHKEILDIVCTEAIEYGGLQEIPGHKDGAKLSFHSPKRGARGPETNDGGRPESQPLAIQYDLRLVQEEDGKLTWKD
jgi:hypothetical protein